MCKRYEEFEELIKHNLFGSENRQELRDPDHCIEVEGHFYDLDECDVLIDEYLFEERDAFNKLTSERDWDFEYDDNKYEY